jgi:hypothetical protein
MIRDQLVDRLGAPEDAPLAIVLGAVRRIEVEAQALRLILQRSKVSRAVLGALRPNTCANWRS